MNGWDLTDREVAHFRVFGFVVLRSALSSADTAKLRGEVEAALARAGTGQRGKACASVTMLDADCPLSRALTVDDRRLHEAAGRLLGGLALPLEASGSRPSGEVPWHREETGTLPGVRMELFLDRHDARTGALRLLPGSHRAGEDLTAYARWHARPDTGLGFEDHLAAFPEHVAEVGAGDVVAYDPRTWRAWRGGHGRARWGARYLADPATPAERADLLALVADAGGPERLYGQWCQAPQASPGRAAALARLTELGAVPGGLTGGVEKTPRIAHLESATVRR